MADMLVKLYELPELNPVMTTQQSAGVDIRRALVAEKHVIVNYALENFSTGWSNQCDIALSNHPLSCFVAVKEAQLIGFACHNATYKGFFGPLGVEESARDKGIGEALLLACLHDMLAQGYGYAIIGGVGPIEFYEKTVGATIIAGSSPGIYRGVLKK